MRKAAYALELLVIKNILLQLSPYPIRTPDNVISASLEIAKMLGSKVTAAVCQIELPIPSNFLATTTGDISAAVAEARRDAEIAAQEVKDVLTRLGEGSYPQIETITLERFADAQSSGLMGHARLSDLVIVPTAPHGATHDLAQDLVFGCGRPVLLLPNNVASPISLAVVVVAWDGSRVAARAISDALPFLRFAQTVQLVEVTGDKPLDGSGSIVALREQLLSHDVHAVAETISSEGNDAGEVLAAYCTCHHADLLVMGAYGHSRIRDFVLGGVTKHFVTDALLPVLLSH